MQTGFGDILASKIYTMKQLFKFVFLTPVFGFFLITGVLLTSCSQKDTKECAQYFDINNMTANAILCPVAGEPDSLYLVLFLDFTDDIVYYSLEKQGGRHKKVFLFAQKPCDFVIEGSMERIKRIDISCTNLPPEDPLVNAKMNHLFDLSGKLTEINYEAREYIDLMMKVHVDYEFQPCKIEYVQTNGESYTAQIDDIYEAEEFFFDDYGGD